MARTPKPWFWKTRNAWFVTINGSRIKLADSKPEALKRFHSLMAEPQRKQVQSDSLVGIIDAFLEWSDKNRSRETYEWYRYHLERFAQRYPDLRANDLRPYHVETWVPLAFLLREVY